MSHETENDLDFVKIADMIANNPIGNLDTELLDNRLLKGKYDISKILKTPSYDAERLRYLKGLSEWLEVMQGHFSNSMYKDDLDWIVFMIRKKRTEVFDLIDALESVFERIAKDKRNSEEVIENDD